MTATNAPTAQMEAMSVHEGLNHPGQSPEPLSIRTDIAGNYYPMIPKPTINGPPQSYYPQPQLSALNQPFHSPAMSQPTMWASPRSSVDDFDNYSYRAPAPTSNYQAASLSPRTWPDSVQTPPPQYEVPFHHQEQYDGLPNGHMGMSPEALRDSSLNIAVDYGNNSCFQQTLTGPHDITPMKYGSPPPMTTTCAPFVASPASLQDQFKTENHPSMSPSPTPSVSGQRTQAARTPPNVGCGDGDSDAKLNEKRETNEPYAQLIWKALKSQPDRCMTLQQLYQWFLKNTDKPEKAGGDGWHNSIRHNLSLNFAFERMEELPTHEITGSSSERIPSKWHLKPDFENGVRPTTHYREHPRNPNGGARRRNTDPNRRRVARTATYHSSPEFPDRTMPGRALSGRRGGRATTSARAAARDLRINTRLAEHAQGSWVPGHSFAAAQIEIVNQQAEEKRRRNRDASARFHMHAAEREAELAAQQQQQHQHHQHQYQQHQPPYNFAAAHYAMNNIAGVYQHPQHAAAPQHSSQPQQQSQPGQSDNVLYGWGGSNANQGM
ncbi:hypothetical protein K4K59_005720 [Colletotrichum sp. SAR11_240]|nr:hypothetical protein K4K59_005720 [Colletotrichum sp. SAR11_240]